MRKKYNIDLSSVAVQLGKAFRQIDSVLDYIVKSEDTKFGDIDEDIKSLKVHAEIILAQMITLRDERYVADFIPYDKVSRYLEDA